MKTRIAIILALAAGFCGAARAQSLPPDAVVLPPTMAAGLLSQCSRDAPERNGPTWQPSVADILALESQLPNALRLDRDQRRIWGTAPEGWRRQYVGIVRGGRRLIYGNFFPRGTSSYSSWRAGPVIECDGGASLFGVVYDVTAHRIIRIAFNGVA